MVNSLSVGIFWLFREVGRGGGGGGVVRGPHPIKDCYESLPLLAFGGYGGYSDIPKMGQFSGILEVDVLNGVVKPLL